MMQGIPQILLIIFLALLLRWCITYHSYSGQGKPPMFGDYEAQRHWQEITLNIPIEKWYMNSTDNDLQYWGLDYPPLTAYHSLLLGHIANKINSSYVKLYESRGHSSADHKYFMRLTVLCADVLVYIPAMIYFIMSRNSSISDRKTENMFGFKKKEIILLTLLNYPGLLLIDYGHFQYNCVSLGFFIAAVTALLGNSYITGSFLFVAALNYKQMELYHSLPIFLYILGNHIPSKTRHWQCCLKMLVCVSFTVILTFIIIWLPFLQNWEVFSHVLIRLFPFARGVFEDKVANIWCAINVVYKLRDVFAIEQLAKVCLIVTTLAILPSCTNLYLNPQKEKFIISLVNSALSFFIFSFQVHEKSILLVAIPILLHFHNDPFPCFWFLLISHFSMLPLYIKDDLFLAYFATLIFYFFFVYWMWPDIIQHRSDGNSEKHTYVNNLLRQNKIKRTHKKIKSSIPITGEKFLLKFCTHEFLTAFLYNVRNFWSIVLFYVSIVGVILLSIASNFITPPQKYPDLFALIVSVYSCGHFITFYLYFNYKQFCTPKTVTKSKTS